MSEASCVNLGERMTLSITPKSCRNFLSRQGLNHDTTSTNKIFFFISLFSNNLKAKKFFMAISNRALPNLSKLEPLDGTNYR